jgi:hypothetical protein
MSDETKEHRYGHDEVPMSDDYWWDIEPEEACPMCGELRLTSDICGDCQQRLNERIKEN